MLEDILMRLLTGQTRGQLQDKSALGKSPLQMLPDASNLDKSVHALATQMMTERMGGIPALGLGFGREVAQGLGQVVQGSPFVGEHGYDPQDMAANMTGYRAAKTNPLRSLMTMLASAGIRQ